MKSDAGPHTVRTSQTPLDWWMAGVITKGTYICGMSWVPQDRQISAPARQNLKFYRGSVMYSQSRWSQHRIALSGLHP